MLLFLKNANNNHNNNNNNNNNNKNNACSSGYGRHAGMKCDLKGKKHCGSHIVFGCPRTRNTRNT